MKRNHRTSGPLAYMKRYAEGGTTTPIVVPKSAFHFDALPDIGLQGNNQRSNNNVRPDSFGDSRVSRQTVQPTTLIQPRSQEITQTSVFNSTPTYSQRSPSPLNPGDPRVNTGIPQSGYARPAINKYLTAPLGGEAREDGNYGISYRRRPGLDTPYDGMGREDYIPEPVAPPPTGGNNSNSASNNTPSTATDANGVPAPYLGEDIYDTEGDDNFLTTAEIDARSKAISDVIGADYDPNTTILTEAQQDLVNNSLDARLAMDDIYMNNQAIYGSQTGNNITSINTGSLTNTGFKADALAAISAISPVLGALLPKDFSEKTFGDNTKAQFDAQTAFYAKQAGAIENPDGTYNISAWFNPEFGKSANRQAGVEGDLYDDEGNLLDRFTGLVKGAGDAIIKVADKFLGTQHLEDAHPTDVIHTQVNTNTSAPGKPNENGLGVNNNYDSNGNARPDIPQEAIDNPGTIYYNKTTGAWTNKETGVPVGGEIVSNYNSNTAKISTPAEIAAANKLRKEAEAEYKASEEKAERERLAAIENARLAEEIRVAEAKRVADEKAAAAEAKRIADEAAAAAEAKRIADEAEAKRKRDKQSSGSQSLAASTRAQISSTSVGKNYQGTGSISGTKNTDDCFTGESIVSIPNGSSRMDELSVGDKVKDANGNTNTIMGIIETTLGARHQIGFNGNLAFTTEEHPFKLKGKGWAAVNPSANTRNELEVAKIEVGDVFSNEVEVKSIDRIDEDSNVKLYDLVLDGTHEYIVNGYEVHNKNQGGLVRQRYNEGGPLSYSHGYAEGGGVGVAKSIVDEEDEEDLLRQRLQAAGGAQPGQSVLGQVAGQAKSMLISKALTTLFTGLPFNQGGQVSTGLMGNIVPAEAMGPLSSIKSSSKKVRGQQSSEKMMEMSFDNGMLRGPLS